MNEKYLIYYYLHVADDTLCYHNSFEAAQQFLSKEIPPARIAQSVEHQTFNLRVQGSSPCSGVFLHLFLNNKLFMSNVNKLAVSTCFLFLRYKQFLNYWLVGFGFFVI